MGALVPGAASTPYKVNTDTGTHWFPAIAAGDPGMVDVAYLETPSIIPTQPNGKALIGQCFAVGPPCNNQNPWNVWAGQSLNLMASGAVNQKPTWTTTKITSAPMHVGDICNVGIFCPPFTSNRNLADFISETVDPQGCAHINYADDNLGKAVFTADQVDGPCVKAAATTTAAPSPSPQGMPLTSSAPRLPGWPLIAVVLAALSLATAAWRPRRRRG